MYSIQVDVWKKTQYKSSDCSNLAYSSLNFIFHIIKLQHLQNTEKVTYTII